MADARGGRMKYYNLNKLTSEEYSNPILIKVNSKTQKMLQKIVKIINEHRVLERAIIAELAKTNNLETYEISDVLADYDFLCDVMEYGNAFDAYSEGRQITPQEYNKLKKVTYKGHNQ